MKVVNVILQKSGLKLAIRWGKICFEIIRTIWMGWTTTASQKFVSEQYLQIVSHPCKGYKYVILRLHISHSTSVKVRRM